MTGSVTYLNYSVVWTLTSATRHKCVWWKILVAILFACGETKLKIKFSFLFLFFVSIFCFKIEIQLGMKSMYFQRGKKTIWTRKAINFKSINIVLTTTIYKYMFNFKALLVYFLTQPQPFHPTHFSRELGHVRILIIGLDGNWILSFTDNRRIVHHKNI